VRLDVTMTLVEKVTEFPFPLKAKMSAFVPEDALTERAVVTVDRLTAAAGTGPTMVVAAPAEVTGPVKLTADEIPVK
jgi:hypothetical protein